MTDPGPLDKDLTMSLGPLSIGLSILPTTPGPRRQNGFNAHAQPEALWIFPHADSAPSSSVPTARRWR